MVRKRLASWGLGFKVALSRKLSSFLPLPGFLKLVGLHLDENGSLEKWQGFDKYNLSPLTESAVLATMTGLFQFIKSDGTKIVLATTPNGLYRHGSPSPNAWNALTMPSGYTWSMDDEDVASFAVLNDICYIFNGTSGNLKYDGTNLWKMGVAAPASAPTVATNGAGVLTGTYSYKVTFLNNTHGHESNGGTVSSNVVAASNQIRLTSIPVSTDPQVDRRRIYRTTAGGAVWLFLHEIADNVTTTYDDNAADTTLGVAIPTTEFTEPPIALKAIVFKGVIFMVPRVSSRVYFSGESPHGVDPNDYRDLDPQDGSVVTGLARLYDVVVATKRDSIWNGTGTDREDFIFIRQVSGVGSVSHHGIVTIPGKTVLAFPAEDGFYTYNGVNEQKIGTAIEPLFAALNQDRLGAIGGLTYRKRNMLIWWASDGSALQNDTLLVYDYDLGQWATRSLSNVKTNVGASIKDGSGNEQFLLGGYAGYAWLGDTGHADDSAAIAVELITRAHGGTADRNSFYELVVWFDPQDGSSLTASYAVDNWEGTYTTIGTVDMSADSGVQRLTYNAQGHRLYIKLAGTAVQQPMIIRGLEVGYKVLGRF